MVFGIVAQFMLQVMLYAMAAIFFMQHKQHKMLQSALLEDSTTGWILLERSYNFPANMMAVLIT